MRIPRWVPLRAVVAAAVLTGAVGVAQLRAADAAPTAAAAASTITVDTDRQFGTLRKAGLGTLFGVAAAPDTPRELMIASQRYLSQHQSAQGDASYPTSTEAVVGKLRGTDVKMIGRYNDLMGGWPYDWKGTADWYAKVDSATRSIQAYKDVLLAVAPFNEPDNKLQGGFAQDAAVPGTTYDEKFNWLWTQTFRRIRAIDPSIPIMGPNYEFYLGWQPALQTKMRDFLVNARNTGTVPNLIGWHNLGQSPGDVPETLSRYYRPLENELGIPGRPLPVVIEEYGSGAAKDFEGVPGSMIKHWAEFERYDVDHAMMGIYTNPGLLGNTLRRTSAGLKPNAGWQMMAWYKAMTGTRVDVSRWDTRHYLACDGVASWDGGNRTVQVLVGGEDNDVDVRVLGLARRGLTGNVRVRVDSAVWTVDPLATDRNVQAGGDWQGAPLNLLDSTMTVDASGALTVPIHRMEGYNGYRILISPAAGPAAYPTKYEAEQAQRVNAAARSGSAVASGNGWVGGIDFADSAVTFTVTAAAAGIHTMTVRYANGTTAANATHTVRVNGQPQGSVTYPAVTSGWANSELRTTTKRVALRAGTNTITLGKGTGYAELDFIDVRPDTHRYEAELATVTNARIGGFRWNEFPDKVGGIDFPDSAVEFAVEAPMTGTYRLEVGYANGTTATSTHLVSVNGGAAGTVSYPGTGAWFDGPTQDRAGRVAAVTVALTAGTNRIRLRKGTGYAELDYVELKKTDA
ncbi:CBM35 domain-containing protein [Dactylosporangium siamense]|uniref:CBM6 domain-containing protein n=1 Tax=Dactylosporangium siamense TaxID=685454 RepID=A0A919UH39_9ACTN|nr:CBM35 domain-containing protein [Dactylosporangium siamense]GIG52016.1 hypothetical protein Dsi01nite_100570 [Dactylosporangium siamense]